MNDQWIIEHEWDIAKLLITNCDYKMLLFKLPQYGLYLQSIAPIPLVHEETPMGLGFHFQDRKQPHVAIVRTESKDWVSDFIQGEKQFEASKIFKHGLYFRALDKHYTIGFVCNTVKNMLHLCEGKTIRILSKNRALRDLFYEKAVTINEEDDTKCMFDYDKYDYVLDIRPYKRYLYGEERKPRKQSGKTLETVRQWWRKLFGKPEEPRIVGKKFHTWAIVTILYGPEMPNHWNMEAEG